MSNTTKIIIIGLIAMFLGLGYILRGTAPDTELRNATTVRTVEVEQNMRTECTRAFLLYGDKLTFKCWGLIMELWNRGYTVNWNDQGEFRMELTQ